MLILTFQNDKTGNWGYANYEVKVRINRRTVRKAKLAGHSKSDGWLVLLEKFVAQEKARYVRAGGRFGGPAR